MQLKYVPSSPVQIRTESEEDRVRKVKIYLLNDGPGDVAVPLVDFFVLGLYYIY
jgi:hypothetical protein